MGTKWYAELKTDPARYEAYLEKEREKYRALTGDDLTEKRERTRKSLRQYRKVHPEKEKERNQRSRDIINQAKVGHSCECGISNPAILEFHHTDKKETALGGAGARHWSREKILAEIDKCVLMCANCHRIRSFESTWKRTANSRQLAYMRRKREVLSDIKTKMGCRVCGCTDARCLDFHHIDSSTKLFSIGSKIGFSMDRILAEVAKCEVLCVNCHRLEHLNGF